jgi:hypothetical protein
VWPNIIEAGVLVFAIVSICIPALNPLWKRRIYFYPVLISEFTLIYYAGYLRHGPPFQWHDLIVHSLSAIVAMEWFGFWKRNENGQVEREKNSGSGTFSQ